MKNFALRDDNSYAMLWKYGIPKYPRARNLYKVRITNITPEVITERANVFCVELLQESYVTHTVVTEADQEDIPSGNQLRVESTYFYKSTSS